MRKLLRSCLLTGTALILPAIWLVGCGSGGADGAAPADLASAKLDGVVLDVDGETALAGGIPLHIVETGAQITTNADGSFSFDELPEGECTLALDPSLATKSLADDAEDDETERDDSEEGGDEAGDDSERRDGSVIIRRVRRGETVFIQIRIENGRIIEIRITRAGDRDNGGHGERELEIVMHKTEANTDPDMEGELELSLEANGDQEFEVEVEDATPGDLLEVVVLDPDDNEESLGFRAVELDGDAEWKLDTGDGDELPFGKQRITGLEGHRVVVRDEEGIDLLRARIPQLPPRDDDVARCIRVRSRARLFPHVEGVRGFVEVGAARCVVDGEVRWLRQIFRIAARGLERGQEAEFFLEDPDNAGSLVSIGTVIANAHGGAQVFFDTAAGDELPFGVATVRELVGLGVQVRDDVTGDVLLSSRVAPTVEE